MSTVAGCENAGVIWDPANALADDDEAPTPVARAFGNKLRHVHLKDFDFVDGKFKPVLTGKGRFPFDEVLRELAQIRYDGFISFEWEKKWYPEIAGVEIAVPQFARWIRQRIEVV
jgi:fatty-acyl-CoA synthase